MNQTRVYLQLKPVSALACLIYSLLALTCSQGVSAADLSIWTSSENVARALEKLSKNFERDYDKKVTISVLNKDLTTQFKTAAIAGKGPDILCWANDVVGELASSGLVEPVIMPRELSQAFLRSALDSFTFEGKLYGYPYDIEAVALITNKNLLPRVPTSFENLANWGEMFQKETPGKYALLFDLKNFYFNFAFLSAGGGYVFGKKETPTGLILNPEDIGLSNEGAIAGANFLKSLTTRGITPSSTDRNVAFEKFLKGELASMIDGPWAIKDLIRSGIPFDVSPLPTLAGKIPGPFVGTHGFIIRRSSKKKDLAKELIEKYLVSAPAMVTLYKEDPRGPSRRDTLELLRNELDPQMLHYLEQFFASAKNATPMPNISAMGPVWSSMGGAFELIFQKGVAPKEALTDATLKIKNAIETTQSEQR